MTKPTPRRHWAQIAIVAAIIVVPVAGLAGAIGMPRMPGMRTVARVVDRIHAPSGQERVATTRTVRSDEDLQRAIAGAVGGDVILLAPGVYERIEIKRRKFDRPLVLASANPARAAIVRAMSITGSSGVTLQDLTFATLPGSRMFGIGAFGSERIRLKRVLGEGPSGAVGYTVSPFMFRDCRDVAVLDSEFRHMWHGPAFLNTSRAIVSGNYLHDIRTDGVRGGGNVEMAIAFNFFTDFHPAPRDHPDAVQMWTTGTSASARDIVIRDNIVIRGPAGSATQGIFLGEESKKYPYLNVLITRNLVIGTLFNGIALGNSTRSMIVDNEVAALPGQKSWIGAITTPDLVMRGNRALLFMVNRVRVRPKGNVETPFAQDGGGAALKQWFERHGIVFDGEMTTIPGQLRALAAAERAQGSEGSTHPS